MKKNSFLLLFAIFSCTIVFAQVPQAVPYQAVARNVAGNLIANQSISVRLSILDGSAAGPVVFQERHTVMTNQFGLFTVNLGQGSLLSGTFPGINWIVNAKYLKVEFDPAGGSSFVNMGTSQLLSVPYALVSGSGANLPNGTLLGNTLRWNGTSWIADNALYNNGLKIGLGTTVPGSGPNPSAKLDIRDEDGNNSDINQTVAGGGFPALLWTKQRGTLAAPQAVTKGTFVGGIQGSYFNGTDYHVGAAMYYVADTTSSVSAPTSIQFRTTGTDSINNLTRMIIKHDGKIGIGTTVPGSGPSPSARLDIRDEDGANSDINQTVAGGGGFPALIWTKQRGTLASPATVNPGTFLGGIQGNYFNGTDFRTGAALYYVADTVIGNWHPASIQFRTTAFGNNTNTTRMTIKHNGNVGVGTQNPEQKFDVRGKVKILDGTEGLNKVFTSDATGVGSWQALPPGNVPNGTLAGNTLRWNGTSWIADNAIFSDGTKVGLGTTEPGLGVNPTAKIDMRDEDGSNSDISQTVAGGGFPALIWTKQRGTLAAPQAVTKGTFVGGIQGSYFNGTDYHVGAAMYYVADTTSSVSAPTSIQFRTTGTDSINNLTRMIIKHDGKIGIGTTVPGSGPSPSARLDIRDEDGANSDINQTVAGGGGFPALIWTKQRGTLASPATVNPGTFLGGIQGNYFNGTDFRTGAALYYVADTVIGNWHPASIQFRTTAFGNNTNTTRMTIKHNGNIGIGTTAPSAKLDVRGTVKIEDGTQGAGKVLTSDAVGTASWQTPVGSGGEPHVAFYAGNTDFILGNQSIPATTVTTVEFGNGYAFFNDGFGYNTVNNRFTPPVAGVYQINVTLNYQGTPGGTIDITLRLGNGGHIVKGLQTIPAGGGGVITLAATYNSNNSAGAPIWVEAYSSNAVTMLKYESGFSAHLVYANPL